MCHFVKSSYEARPFAESLATPTERSEGSLISLYVEFKLKSGL